jgi:hypothetical protein
MDKVTAFLDKELISVFTVMLPDEVPHSAAVGFSYETDPFRVYISTNKDTVKMSGLLNGESRPASMVVGWSVDEFITVQMRGTARKIEGEELAAAQKVHYAKNPSSMKRATDPTNVFICFDVTWWRYSALKSDPKEIISSEG